MASAYHLWQRNLYCTIKTIEIAGKLNINPVGKNGKKSVENPSTNYPNLKQMFNIWQIWVDLIANILFHLILFHNIYFSNTHVLSHSRCYFWKQKRREKRRNARNRRYTIRCVQRWSMLNQFTFLPSSKNVSCAVFFSSSQFLWTLHVSASFLFVLFLFVFFFLYYFY